IPHRARFVGSTVVARPRAYAVPAAVAAHLARHGLRIEPAPDHAVTVAVARVEQLGGEAGRHILEASTVGELTVSWRDDARALPPGYALVPTDQPLGAIAVYLCEPESDDGAVENGLLAAPSAGDDYPIWRVS
ncbi:MAG: peptidase, partial [Deltaproteobacteria bacterium]|nr:peptidase [Kofleriaceae bacterium]